MAKMCMIERELKRRNMVEKFKTKRAAFKSNYLRYKRIFRAKTRSETEVTKFTP